MQRIASDHGPLTLADGSMMQPLALSGSDDLLRQTQGTRTRTQLAVSVMAQVLGEPWSKMVPRAEPAQMDGGPDQTAPHTIISEMLGGEPIGAVDPDDSELHAQLDAAGLLDALAGQQERDWSGVHVDAGQLRLAMGGGALPDSNDYAAPASALQHWRASDAKGGTLSEVEVAALERLDSSGYVQWVEQLLGPDRAGALAERLQSMRAGGRVLGAPSLRPARTDSYKGELPDFGEAWNARRSLAPALAAAPPQLSSLDAADEVTSQMISDGPRAPLREQIERVGAEHGFAAERTVQMGEQEVSVLHMPFLRGSAAGGYTRLRWQTDKGASMQLVSAQIEGVAEPMAFVTMQPVGAADGDIAWVVPLTDRGEIDLSIPGWPGVKELIGDERLLARLMETLQPMLASFDLPAVAVGGPSAEASQALNASGVEQAAVLRRAGASRLGEDAMAGAHTVLDGMDSLALTPLTAPERPKLYDQNTEPAWQAPAHSPVSATGRPATHSVSPRPSLSQIGLAGAAHSVTGDTPGYISW